MKPTYLIEQRLEDDNWVPSSDPMDNKDEAVKAFHQKAKNMPMSVLRLTQTVTILQTRKG